MALVNIPSKKKIKRIKDRISDLPDVLLEYIVSLLTIKQAVRTTVLSKRWKRINPCFMRPSLRFTEGFFPAINVGAKYNSNVRRKYKRALRVVDKLVLRERQEGEPIIQEFCLMDPLEGSKYRRFQPEPHRPPGAPLLCPFQDKLDTWMNCVAKLGLTVLHLDIQYRPNATYDLPLDILASATSLKVLSLFGFVLEPLSFHEVDVQFSSLQTLCLERTKLDEFVLQKLLKGSPLIEKLQLKGCVRFKVLDIKGLIWLKVLELVLPDLKLEKIEIDAPNLAALKVHADSKVISIADCPQYLQNLDISGPPLPRKMAFELQGRQLSANEWFHRFLTMCPLLEHLAIDSCRNLSHIGSSTTLDALKSLYFFLVGYGVEYDIIAPKLEKLKMTTNPKFPVVRLKASDNLEVRVSFLASRTKQVFHGHDKLATFLGSFNHSTKFSFTDFSMFFVVPKEKRNKIASPLYGTRKLEFIIYKMSRHKNGLAECVDYMLWLSPRATNLEIRDNYGVEVVLECKHKNVKGTHGVASCPSCNLLPIRCWRHSLSEVYIQEFRGGQVEKENLKSFLRKEVKTVTFRETSYDPETIEGGLYRFYDKLFK